jgi:hypothetical protein
VVEGTNSIGLPNLTATASRGGFNGQITQITAKNFPVAARLPESFKIFDGHANREPWHNIDRTPSACGSMINASSYDGSFSNVFCVCVWQFCVFYVFFRKAYSAESYVSYEL